MTPYVFLPDRETILANLTAVNSHNDLVRDGGFYPMLAMRAGQRFTPLGVVNLIIVCIGDYTEHDAPTRRVLVAQIPGMIDALIPNSPTAAEEARWHYSQMQRKAAGG